MRSLMFLTFVLGTCSLSHAVAANEIDLDQTSVQDTTNWSVGAGLGWRVTGGNFFSMMGAADSALGMLSGGRSSAPSALLLVERQLTKRAHLLFDLGGSYSTFDHSDNHEETYWSIIYDDSVSAWAGLGLRWVFNPEGIVTVSGIISFQGGWAKARGRDFDTVFEDDGTETEIENDLSSVSYAFGPQIGVALERKLIDNLFLRFESNLLGASWESNSLDTTPEAGPTETSESSSFSVGLVLSPSIQLRLLI